MNVCYSLFNIGRYECFVTPCMFRSWLFNIGKYECLLLFVQYR